MKHTRKILPYIEINDTKSLPMPKDGLVEHYVFQYVDFNEVPDYGVKYHFHDCLFTGCVIPQAMNRRICEHCLVFPRMGMIYKAFANCLYTGDTLYEGYDPARPESFKTCFDSRVYEDYIRKGKHAEDFRETLARSLHDHAMTDAMYELLDNYDEMDVVAVMGGHAMKRTDDAYYKVARISKALTEHGALMVSGGGPGAMEATHFGAWMAGRTDEEFHDALKMISYAPTFRDEGWLESCFAVRAKYPQTEYHSLGVPTWFYGHEPATAFATDIAKYFDNSIREDGILTIAKGGVIYSPGSAGTMQEIFQDAAQNHYETYGYASPMVFLGVEYYTEEMPVYPFIQKLVEAGKYKNLKLAITDNWCQVVSMFCGSARD